MKEEKSLTAQEWADMSAEALARRNKEILEGMLKMLIEAQADNDTEKKKEHWRNVFVSSAICGGSSSQQAIAIANECVDKLYNV